MQLQAHILKAFLLDCNAFHSPLDQHMISTQPGRVHSNIRAVRVHTVVVRLLFSAWLWNTRDLLKMRLKVTSVFMAVRPHPHVLKHQASTAAQDLELAVALSKVATQPMLRHTRRAVR